MPSLHHMSPNSDVEGDLPGAEEKVAPGMVENSKKETNLCKSGDSRMPSSAAAVAVENKNSKQQPQNFLECEVRENFFFFGGGSHITINENNI